MNDRLFCQIPRPKIGIRVVVDGRCNGVREKIEAPTFALAQKAKELLESHVFHADGQPLECVIGSVGVGGVREAALVAQEFSQENVGAVISISRAFAYAAEVMVYDDPQLPLQNKRAFPSSRYTARMYRMQMIYLYRRMLQKS